MDANTADPAGKTDIRTIDLDTPIVRGEQTISKLQLRKPDAGGLRGLSLLSLMQMNTDELTKVLPRITIPTLTAQECRAMDPADLVQCAAEVSDFLLPKAKKPVSQEA
ncbi:MAG: phage tail assembly protein [Allosphingosinicella sp.]|uniref:phage tail assembly protein n=1 Tax=Allosphingosinicella sp. TaxID=2823234 RepID=UPI003953B9E3